MIDKIYEKRQTNWETFRVAYDALEQYLVTIDETNPIYLDQQIAKKAGFQDRPLPPTYPSIFWQDFHIPWLDNQALFMLNAQTFTYQEPMVINYEYRGQITLNKLRNHGNKQFAVHVLQLYDQEKNIATIKTTLMLTEEGVI